MARRTCRIELASLLIASLLASGSALADGVLFVNDDAAPGGDGRGWATAYTHLQDALTATRNSGGAVGEIWIAAGTYRPDRSSASPSGTGNRNAAFQLIAGVALRGGFAGNEDPSSFDLANRDLEVNRTVLSGDLAGNDTPTMNNRSDNSYHVLTGAADAVNAVLDGLVVQGGNAESAAQAFGGGIYNLSGALTAVNCVFMENTAGTGGAILSGGLTLRNCRFINNVAIAPGSSTARGGAIHGTGTVTNCLFRGNSVSGLASSRGAISIGSGSMVVTNCTLAGNSSGIYVSGGTLTVANSILWANAAGAINGSATVSYSCIEGGWLGAGNISADPRLIRVGNLRLRRGSPCIDAGNNEAIPAGVTTDAAGASRIIDDLDTADTGNPGGAAGAVVDMGAYEYQPVPAERLYVKAGAAAEGDGSNWTSACPHLQDALAASGDRPGVSEIWVAGGTYRPDQGAGQTAGDRWATFGLQGGLALYGGFAGVPGTEDDRDARRPALYPSILSGDLAGDDGPDFANNTENSYHVAESSVGGAATILDGFTIAGGHDNSSSFGHGGGLMILRGSATLRNCVFRSCKAAYGAALYAGGAMILTNCIFDRNAGSQGGGLYLSSGGAAVTNCTFFGNAAGQGVAVYSVSPPSTTVRNCILWGSSTSQSYGPVTVTYSCIEGGFAGEGNISADPLFANAAGGNLRLSPASPCIDAGSNAAVPEGTLTDAGGNLRFFDAPGTPDCAAAPGTCGDAPIVDMGACEYISPIPGDLEGDGDVDADDFSAFKACASGAAVALGTGCTIADLDADQDADMDDFGIFQRCYSGARRAADPACGG